jgi:exosortase/archaeosortase family protein
MDTLIKKYSSLQFPAYQMLIGLGMLLMTIEPIAWLVNTWFEPAHDSQGGWIFLLCAGLFFWSISSKKQVMVKEAGLMTASPLEDWQSLNQKKAAVLLLFTTLIRAIGQIFAVNVLGAVALAIDVYAIGLLAGLKDRKKPLSAGWLAILFAFSLPLERMLQRIIGFGLQHLSADGACLILQGLFADVQCAGIRILLAGRDVLVDLPCSGVKTIMLLCILYAALMCVFRPSLLNAVLIGLVTLVSALLANMIRISCLAIFIAYPEKIGGIDVMAQPWHDLIGLFCLVLAALPLVLLCNKFAPSNCGLDLPGFKNLEGLNDSKTKILPALSFLILATIIVSLPRHALDVSSTTTPLNLPVYLHGQYGQAVALTAQEQSYFTQFGGAAIKMRYGNNSALLIRTTSPLRHLHSPDDCLRGLGFDVQYQGIQYQPLPTAIYTATAKNGTQWRVAVTFYSAQKKYSSNISEVVWRWLQNPHSTWYALQRITPIQTSISKVYEWDNALFAALDLSSTHL